MKYSLKPAVLALALPFLAFATDPTPQEAAPSVPVPTIAVRSSSSMLPSLSYFTQVLYSMLYVISATH